MGPRKQQSIINFDRLVMGRGDIFFEKVLSLNSTLDFRRLDQEFKILYSLNNTRNAHAATNTKGN